MQRKLKVGDRVEIINYGHIIYGNNGIEVTSSDMSPQLIGQIGIISTVNTISGFAIEGIQGKHAWYHRDQLKWLPPIEVMKLLDWIEEYTRANNDLFKEKIIEIWKIE